MNGKMDMAWVPQDENRGEGEGLLGRRWNKGLLLKKGTEPSGGQQQRRWVTLEP